MTLKDEKLDLKELHEDFIKNMYFSAFSLMTPKGNWLSIDKKEEDIRGKISEAKQKKIFNIVVEEDGQVIGSINVKDISNDICDDLVKNVNEYQIDAYTDLPRLSEIMYKDSKVINRREDSPLYFVVQSKGMKRELIGIMTFWDLNRAPSYIFSYTALVYLEHTLLLKIRDSHKEWYDHSDVIDKIWQMEKPPKYRECIKKFINTQQKTYNYRKLSRWGLPELLAFYKFDEHIAKDPNQNMESLVGLFNEDFSFRNKIGHSVKLLVNDNEEFQEDLKKLNAIWKYGKQAFVEFTDPKVSHSSPILEDL